MTTTTTTITHDAGDGVAVAGTIDDHSARFTVHLDDEHVGTATFAWYPGGHAVYGCGWTLADPARHGRRGIMTRALPAMLTELAARGVSRGQTVIFDNNTASVALAQRAGLRRAGAHPAPGASIWTWGEHPTT